MLPRERIPPPRRPLELILALLRGRRAEAARIWTLRAHEGGVGVALTHRGPVLAVVLTANVSTEGHVDISRTLAARFAGAAALVLHELGVALALTRPGPGRTVRVYVLAHLLKPEQYHELVHAACRREAGEVYPMNLRTQLVK